MIELNFAKTITFEGYMDAVTEVISQETERIENYFDESSVKSVVGICEESLIKGHSERFNLSLKGYLETDNRACIAKLFDLVSRFPENIGILRSTFRAHIEKVGDDSISGLENIVSVDPKTYVESIIKVYKHYDSLVTNELRNDTAFRQDLETAMKIFMNNNAVTQASDFDDRNAELLAKYCDIMLTKDAAKVVPENELEQAVQHVIMLYKLLNDKHGFQKFYENITVRRLIFHQSVSTELEEVMILELKEYFGGQDSHTLKRISENIKTSETVNEEFKTILDQEGNSKLLSNFSVVILPDKHCKRIKVQAKAFTMILFQQGLIKILQHMPCRSNIWRFYQSLLSQRLRDSVASTRRNLLANRIRSIGSVRFCFSS